MGIWYSHVGEGLYARRNMAGEYAHRTDPSFLILPLHQFPSLPVTTPPFPLAHSIRSCSFLPPVPYPNSYRSLTSLPSLITFATYARSLTMPQLLPPINTSLLHTSPMCSYRSLHSLHHTLKNRSIVSVSRLQELGHYELCLGDFWANIMSTKSPRSE